MALNLHPASAETILSAAVQVSLHLAHSKRVERFDSFAEATEYPRQFLSDASTIQRSGRVLATYIAPVGMTHGWVINVSEFGGVP